MTIEPSAPIKRPVVFTAIDGVIRKSKSGTSIINGVDDMVVNIELIRILWEYRKKGFCVVGLSNENGIGNNTKTHEQFVAELSQMIKMIEPSPYQAFKWTYFCPSALNPLYAFESKMRKPDIGMIVQQENHMFALHKWILDYSSSIMVGIEPEDKQLAKNAGIDYYPIGTFMSMPHFFGHLDLPIMPSNMKEAAEWITIQLETVGAIVATPIEEFVKKMVNERPHLLIESGAYDQTHPVYLDIVDKYGVGPSDVPIILAREVHNKATTIILSSPHGREN